MYHAWDLYRRRHITVDNTAVEANVGGTLGAPMPVEREQQQVNASSLTHTSPHGYGIANPVAQEIYE